MAAKKMPVPVADSQLKVKTAGSAFRSATFLEIEETGHRRRG